jgi:hypothetical protein
MEPSEELIRKIKNRPCQDGIKRSLNMKTLCKYSITLKVNKQVNNDRFLAIVGIVNKYGISIKDGRLFGTVIIAGKEDLYPLHSRLFKLNIALQYFITTGQLLGLGIIGRTLLVIEGAVLIANGNVEAG